MSEYYYCPKCNNKKLVSDCWNDNGTYRTSWTCHYNAPTRHQTPSDPCGCVIQVPGRDANIEDYHSALDKIANAMDTPQIVAHLLAHDQRVYRKGLEVIYAGEFMDVVRRRRSASEYLFDGPGGIGAAIYWKAVNVDKDEHDVFNPLKDRQAIYLDGGKRVHFRGVALSEILHEDGYLLWMKDHHQATFKGNLGKRLKADIVEWSAAFEKAVPGLLEKARKEAARWVAARSKLQDDLKNSGVSFGDAYYNVDANTVSISLRDVSIDEAVSLEKVWPEEITVGLINSRSHVRYITLDEVRQVSELLNMPDIEIRLYTREHVSPELAITIAKILKKSGS